MDYEAKIPRGKISTTREFALPFRTRSSSHTPQCNCPQHDHTSTPSTTSQDSSSTLSMADPKSKSSESYFTSLPSLKSDDECSSNEENNETNTKRGKDAGLSSSPTAADTENKAGHANQSGIPPSNFARLFAYGLIGMSIDYNGDILDSLKKSCGKASGDITEMVGQKIDEDGLIRDKNGGVVGQVAQNYGLQEAVAAMLEVQKKKDGGGNRGSSNAKQTEEQTTSNGTKGGQEGNQELPNIWKGTVGEDAAPGNDIHLNVQSTKEGISMSIRIPTMFMKEQHRLFEEEKKANEKSANEKSC